MLGEIKIVGFDADDTLWINEPLYQETEKQFCNILTPYSTEEETTKELFKTEMQNLEMYGYGAKGFLLSMIETALKISEKKIPAADIILILELGKKLLNEPIILLDNVEHVLQKLKPKYKLILATKGDLLDQERKLRISGLSDYFHHIEIMSDKHENNYSKLIRSLDIKPAEFVMIGNSVKSDILPVINVGARAIHVPFEVTWQHEKHHEEPGKDRFITVNNLTEVLDIL
jgi:putative hydrolase of the HAD superfamily